MSHSLCTLTSKEYDTLTLKSIFQRKYIELYYFAIQQSYLSKFEGIQMDDNKSLSILFLKHT